MTRAALAVWDFIVGDDWRTAAGVVVALGTTAIVAAAGVAAWWVTPVALPVLLWRSLRRECRPTACGRRAQRWMSLTPLPHAGISSPHHAGCCDVSDPR
jgi:hypothetical protein